MYIGLGIIFIVSPHFCQQDTCTDHKIIVEIIFQITTESGPDVLENKIVLSQVSFIARYTSHYFSFPLTVAGAGHQKKNNNAESHNYNYFRLR
jgi:hypothetical protein